MIRKILLAGMVLLALPALGLVVKPAAAQTCAATQTSPGFTQGGNLFGRIAAQWNVYFANKADTNNGTLCNPTLMGTISGTAQVLASMLPNPTTVTLGGVKSLAAVSGRFLTGIDTSGNPTIADAMLPAATNASLPNALNNLSSTTIGHTFYAPAFVGEVSGALCTWDDTHDVGDCINGAINAAAAGGGGRVVAPSGSFGETVTVNMKSKVFLEGAGAAGGAVCGTKLTWLGAGGANMVQVNTSTATAPLVLSAVKDLCLAGNGIAARAVEMWSVWSIILDNVVISNVTTDGVYIDSTDTVLSSGVNPSSIFLSLRDLTVNLCNAASVNANGIHVGPGTSTGDLNRSKLFGGVINQQRGKGVIFGGSDANWWFGGVVQPCSSGAVGATAAAIASAGSGYTNGDVVTMSTATSSSPSTACASGNGLPTFTLTVLAGTVTAATPLHGGYCVDGTKPADPVQVTGGTGSGLTLNITWATATGTGVLFSAEQGSSATERSRGNMLYGTIVGAGQVGGIRSEAGAAGLKSGKDNVYFGRKREDGEPTPTCDAQGSATDAPAFYWQTVDGIITSCGPNGWITTNTRIRWDPVVVTADTTITADQSGAFFSNTGATTDITLTLPTATASGNWYCFDRNAAHKITLQVAGGSEIIRISDTIASNAGGSISGNVVGAAICLFDNGTGSSWRAMWGAANWATDNGVTAYWALQLGTGVQAFLATPSSANLAAALTDETGTGPAVFGTNPVLSDPAVSGFKVSTADVSITSSTVFVNVTGLSIPLAAGKTYSCKGWLSISAIGASGGVKATLFASGGLTQTAMRFTAVNLNGTTSNARNTVTAFSNDMGGFTGVATDIFIDGSLTVGVAGSIILRATQNASNATTTTVAQGSTFNCVRANE